MTARQTREQAWCLTCKLAAIVSTMLACSIPVHFTQSPHILVYTQRFAFCAEQDVLRKDLLEWMFGITPQDAPPAKNIEKIAIRGSVYFRVVSIPGDPTAFTIQGHGWHRMYYGMTGDEDSSRYLASADYQILDDGPIYISELRRASLVIRVIVLNKTYFSQPDLTTMLGEGVVFIKIFLKKIADNVYVLDFDREHIVGVKSPIPSDGPMRIQPIGYMQLVSPSDEQNLWDFRQTAPVAMDYAAMMTTRIGASSGQPNPRAAEWLPEHPCQDLRKGQL